MLKIFRNPLFSRPVALMLIWLFMLLSGGCKSYFKVNRPEGKPGEILTNQQDKDKFIILHLEDKAWRLSDITVSDKSIEGKISILTDHDRYKTVREGGANRYRKRSSINEEYILDEVHLWVAGFSEKNKAVSIPMESVRKIEVYDKARGATAISWAFGTIGIAAGVGSVAFVILLLTKSSCPFVYAYDGDNYTFNGEIFSGATQPGLERDDYMPLPRLVPSDDCFKIRLTNEVREKQYVNLASLIIVDHPKGIRVLADRNGKMLTVNNPVPPSSAQNLRGKDISMFVSHSDSLSYSGETATDENISAESMIMTFPKPAEASSGNLVIRAKNTFWLDVLFTRFHRLFGDRFASFSAKQEAAGRSELTKYLLDQDIPLSVYIMKDGKWHFEDYFNIAGPMAMRDDIMKLDLSGTGDDSVRIKIETGFLFWELDYAAIDFSPGEIVTMSEFPVITATDGDSLDVKASLEAADKNYLALEEPGDEVQLTFAGPGSMPAEGRTVFLHTRGYYKILREQSGTADVKALKKFRKPHYFTEFSRSTYDLLPVSLK